MPAMSGYTSAAVLACRTWLAYVPNGPSTWVTSPNRITAFDLTESTGVTDTPTMTGFAVPIVE